MAARCRRINTVTKVVQGLVQNAFPAGVPGDDDFHRSLAAFGYSRLLPRVEADDIVPLFFFLLYLVCSVRISFRGNRR